MHQVRQAEEETSKTMLESCMKQYQEIDRSLYLVEQQIRFLDYIQPRAVLAEREKFFEHTNDSPKWSYEPLPFHTEEFRSHLNGIYISREVPYLESLFQERRRNLVLLLDYLDVRGDHDIALKYSLELYGKPRDTIVKEANRLLTECVDEDSVEESVSPDAMKAQLQEMLCYYGLDDWKLCWYERRQMSIDPACRLIYVPATRAYSVQDSIRLCIHEVGVHALRAENGYQQPFSIFATGLPGYELTEEGLATYAEECSNTSSIEVMRRYAARVLAVQSLVEGAEFKDTYHQLKTPEYQLSDTDAFNAALRVHRGGGFTKDYIYLQGLHSIRSYVAEGGDIGRLFQGKIGLEHIEFTDKLSEECPLQAARCIPDVFQTHNNQ